MCIKRALFRAVFILGLFKIISNLLFVLRKLFSLFGITLAHIRGNCVKDNGNKSSEKAFVVGNWDLSDVAIYATESFCKKKKLECEISRLPKLSTEDFFLTPIHSNPPQSPQLSTLILRLIIKRWKKSFEHKFMSQIIIQRHYSLDRKQNMKRIQLYNCNGEFILRLLKFHKCIIKCYFFSRARCKGVKRRETHAGIPADNTTSLLLKKNGKYD